MPDALTGLRGADPWPHITARRSAAVSTARREALACVVETAAERRERALSARVRRIREEIR